MPQRRDEPKATRYEDIADGLSHVSVIHLKGEPRDFLEFFLEIPISVQDPLAKSSFSQAK